MPYQRPDVAEQEEEEEEEKIKPFLKLEFYKNGSYKNIFRPKDLKDSTFKKNGRIFRSYNSSYKK